MLPIGELIRSRRVERGLKVFELAEKVGVSPVYITQIEKHNKVAALAVYVAIAKILHIPNIMSYAAEARLNKLYTQYSELKKYTGKISKGRWDVSSRLTLESKNEESLINEFWRFVFEADDTRCQKFVRFLLLTYKPSEVNNKRLISSITKALDEIRQNQRQTMELYLKAEKKILSLLRPLT